MIATSRRLFALVLGAILATIAVGTLIGVLLVRARLIDNIDDALRADSASTASVLAAAEPATLRQLSEQPSAATRSTASLIVDSTGRTVAFFPSGRVGQADPPPDVDALGYGRLLARAGRPFGLDSVQGGFGYRVLVTRIDPQGVLVLAAPLENVQRTLTELVTVLSATALAATAILAAVAWAALRAGVRPYDHMIDTVNAVADGHLSHRAELVTGDVRVARLGEAVDRMLDRIEAALAAQEVSEARLKDFLAAASHELRTPLTSVRGYADLYLSGAAAAPDDTGRAMRRISAEAQRMAHVVDDLLTLARLDQHRPLDPRSVDLVAVIDDSVTDLRAAQPERPICWRPAGPMTVVSDERVLRHIFANLLANLRVHTPVTAAADITVEAADGAISVAVRDLGPGMDAQTAAHVFDAFYRAEGSRNRDKGGSGLGLAIAAALTHALGGRLTLLTEPGGGATFTVTIPLGFPLRAEDHAADDVVPA